MARRLELEKTWTGRNASQYWAPNPQPSQAAQASQASQGQDKVWEPLVMPGNGEIFAGGAPL